MTLPRISKATAKISASLIRTMGDQGVLPKTEAQAAAAVLLSAAKSRKPGAKAGGKPCLLTTAEVATRLSCSRKSVFRISDDGHLTRRYLRPGNPKSLRFIEAEVSALCGMPADEEKP
jgi:hypothetical protein